MNSVSLYNQAISYYEEYHHPKSDYSIEVIHLEELEQIAEPNLKVNSRIRIYNEELELAEGEYYPGKNTGNASQEKLNNISFTNNEVVITSLEYELRKSAALSISVQRLVQYQSILQKLIKNIK
jgi:alpha-N-acetylglucosamine transferase